MRKAVTIGWNVLKIGVVIFILYKLETISVSVSLMEDQLYPVTVHIDSINRNTTAIRFDQEYDEERLGLRKNP